VKQVNVVNIAAAAAAAAVVANDAGFGVVDGQDD